MGYQTKDGKEEEFKSTDYTHHIIDKVEEKTGKNDNVYLMFHCKEMKDKDPKVRKHVMFKRLIGTNISFYDAILDACGIDRNSTFTDTDFLGKEVSIDTRIDPAKPTRVSADGRDTYDNYEVWDVYTHGADPNRSEGEYTALCEEHGFVPKSKQKKADDNTVPGQPGFEGENAGASAATDTVAPEDLPF